MRRLVILSPFLVLLMAAPLALASEDTTRTDVAVREHLRMGLQGVTAACKQLSPARKLAVADRALFSLHRARALQLLRAKPNKALERTIESGLIAALNVKTRVYLVRGSLPKAKRLNEAALAYETVSVTALKLRVEIQKAILVDVYERIDGRHGIDRLRERHDAIGAPLRDRGAARRR